MSNVDWGRIGFNVFMASLLIFYIVVALVLFSVILSPSQNPCGRPYSFECRDVQVQACLKSEKYTLDQCVTLVGGGGG